MSNIILSASKINTFSGCSFTYYANYELGMKSGDNSGSRRGTVVHVCFENLLKSSRRHYFDKIMSDKTIKNCPPILRLVRKISNRIKLDSHDNKDQHNRDLIDEMIVTGLSCDFYCEGGVLEEAETEFSYEGEGYAIRGAIDKIVKYQNGYKIIDYKSSASKYSGEDLEMNFQSLLYSLWFYRTRGVIPEFQFIFLRFPEDPYINKKYDEETILGFEQYLIYITKYLQKFDMRKATAGLAADKGYPTDGSFGGKVMCGFSKYPGHISPKTGKEYWACYYKYARPIYYIKDNKGEVRYTTDKIDDILLEEGDTFEIFPFKGCPAWNKSFYEQ